MGRPSTYTPERGKAICKRLSEGESLTTICKDATTPKRDTVYKWIADNEGFRDDYALAREQYADYVFDGLLDICDNPDLAPQDVQKARLQIDTRKWVLARMSPKKYGEKAALELSGEGGGPIVITYDKDFEGV